MLKTRLQEDVKSAMREKAKEKLAALRLVMASIKQKEVDTRTELDDAQITQLLQTLIKQRKESIEQYQAADRVDLVEKEQFELDLILTYLPEPISDSELEQVIQSVIAETGASGMQDMGKVMSLVKTKVEGRADMGQVSQKVKASLAGK